MIAPLLLKGFPGEVSTESLQHVVGDFSRYSYARAVHIPVVSEQVVLLPLTSLKTAPVKHFSDFVMSAMSVPLAVLTDSYKATHFQMYPDAKKMVAYGEFRTSFANNKDDSRLLFYGIRYSHACVVVASVHLLTLRDADTSSKTTSTRNGPWRTFRKQSCFTTRTGLAADLFPSRSTSS